MAGLHADQRLNDWVQMLHDIYGNTQNYAKTPFELHAHLTEVTGITGKRLLKHKDVAGARSFAAKAFAWAVALFMNTSRHDTRLEDLLLRKFPGACPYCHNAPCTCWNALKPTLNEERVRNAYYRYAAGAKRGANDFQLLFKLIYGNSWGDSPEVVPRLLTRLLEELAELGEAIRFAHLYPANLANELADFLAWWFALVSTMHLVDGKSQPILAAELLWSAYPGYCRDCDMSPCLCRPGPVRELVSKPPPGALDRLDGLTLVFNQRAFDGDVADFENREAQGRWPIACIRVDVDDFKAVNDKYGHAAGDQALRHLVSIVKQKIRERDRIYRAGGDEFVILCSDYSGEEANGTMRRVISELRKRPVRWVSENAEAREFLMTVSVGISECVSSSLLTAALKAADDAAYESKRAGKDRVTVATPSST